MVCDISFHRIYGLYGLKYQIGKISGDVTDAGRTKTSEESVTQLLICKSQKITRGQRHSWRADHALSQIKYETNLIVSLFFRVKCNVKQKLEAALPHKPPRASACCIR